VLVFNPEDQRPLSAGPQYRLRNVLVPTVP